LKFPQKLPKKISFKKSGVCSDFTVRNGIKREIDSFSSLPTDFPFQKIEKSKVEKNSFWSSLKSKKKTSYLELLLRRLGCSGFSDFQKSLSKNLQKYLPCLEIFQKNYSQIFQKIIFQQFCLRNLFLSSLCHL